jgi:predicted XRE-type DNA-binding protein
MRNGSKKTPSNADATDRVERGSGNVFADLGLPHPEIALAKAELVQRIRHVIAEQKLTQAQAGKRLGIDQPKVSALLRGRVDGYTLDRLLRYLTVLGQSVEIHVSGKSPKRTEPALRLILA